MLAQESALGKELAVDGPNALVEGEMEIGEGVSPQFVRYLVGGEQNDLGGQHGKIILSSQTYCL